MLNPKAFVTELMRAPVMGVDHRSQVRTVLAYSEDSNVHFFAVQRQGKVVGRVCACDLRDARPDSSVLDAMLPLLVTLSPDTTLEESLAIMRPGMDWTIVRDRMDLVGVVTWHDIRQAIATYFGEHDDHICSGCGVDHRLRIAKNDLVLCPDCSDRAEADDWYDLGAAG